MAGKIILQANDGKTLSLTAPEGMSSNTTDVVATRGYVDSELALHSTDALGISGNTLYLYKGNGANESVTLPVQTSVTGNAGTATKLATARTITLSGDVTGSVSFDGSANTTITATVADDSHNHVISNVDGLQTALDGKLGSTATATTATKLATARTINGVAFDGTSNITLTDNLSRIYPNTRERVFPYDYSSDFYGTGLCTMTQMYNTSKITSYNGGITNASSHLGGTNQWNFKSMLEIGYSLNNFMYGAKITVPAYTDLVTVEGHSGGTQILSLTDIATGSGVCGVNGSTNNRFYNQHGNSSHRALCDGFGNLRHTAYHHPVHLPVPNLPVDKDYVLVRGCHHRNQAESGWVSGISFNTNPRKFISLMGTGVHWYLNGGSTGISHNSWGWNSHELVYVPQGTGHWVKFPIAPGDGDRVLFIIAHGGTHSQTLEYIQCSGGIKRSLRGANSSSPAFQMMTNTSNSHRVDEVRIPATEIPSAVRTSGGFVDVYLDNSKYGNHHYYFSTIGSYLPNVIVNDSK